jgi:hypothetical protein
MLAHTHAACTFLHTLLSMSRCFNRINLSRTIALHREAAASSAASTTETTSGGTGAPESEFLAVKDVKESVEPMSAVRLDQASEAQWRAVGYSAVLNASVAVVTLAGGQGESVFRRATVQAGGVVGVVQNVVSVSTGVGGVVKDTVWYSQRSLGPFQLRPSPAPLPKHYLNYSWHLLAWPKCIFSNDPLQLHWHWAPPLT